jgi:peptide/nickel transport system substrate-binding protein
MKSKIMWLILSCLLVLSMVLASCGTKTTTTTSPTTKPTSTLITTPTTNIIPTTKPTTTPATTTGNWWDKFGTPKYGGTIIIRKASDPLYFDPYFGTENLRVQSYYMETLAIEDWTLDRQIWSFKIRNTPLKYFIGCLAESWETPDMATYIFHIRQGIHWQDIPPVNGREFIASDVEFNWQRMLGLGSGYSKPSTFYSTTQYSLIKSVTATDKYTVVFKLSEPSLSTLSSLLHPVTASNVLAPEAVKQWGDVNNWKRAIGTGPFILKDYVSGSALTYSKNPNYWGYDQRHTENKLPYSNEIKILIIPDMATTLAALRTGKLDLIGGGYSTAEFLNLQQSESLKRANPELLQVDLPADGVNLDVRVDKVPFSDIRVRKALNMAINRNEIAKDYYGGAVDGMPYGLIGPALNGYYTPFDQWPQDVKDGYTYNPEGAKKLLADAGYPNGFKTNIVASSTADQDLLQVAKAYFAKIGVDMEIRVMDPTTYTAFTQAQKHDAMAIGGYAAGSVNPPLIIIANYTTTTQKNRTALTNDPIYDALYNKANTILTEAEQMSLIREADAYATAKYWGVKILPQVVYSAYQPWLKGYSGETYLGGFEFARFWVDKDLVK